MFNQKKKKAFGDYEVHKANIKVAEEKLKELKPILMEAIPDGKEIEGENGFFKIQNRSKYEYTDKVKQYEKNLKQLKKDEEATGDAKQSLVPTLYYLPYKED